MSDAGRVGVVAKKMTAKKKVKTDWICVNPECTKSRSDDVVTARPFVVCFFGAKVDPKCKRKVCLECLVFAENKREKMVERLKSGQPVVDEPMPVFAESAIVLDDSDEEKKDGGFKTDSSSDSEVEFDLGEVDSVEKLVEDTMTKFAFIDQVDNTVKSIEARLAKLNPEEIDSAFDDIEHQVDAIREALYAPFRPQIKSLPAIILQDSADVPKTAGATGESEVLQVLPSVAMRDASLPPMGSLPRPALAVGSKIYAMRGNILNVWKECSVFDIKHDNESTATPYKVRFDIIVNGKIRSAQYKLLSPKHIAYYDPAPVRLQVGTRIIGIYVDADNPAGGAATREFYSGIVAEPPKTMNRHRYLVFFDDGYASYIKHEDIRVVVNQTHPAVWEDIHPNSRDFIKKYLQQYPERPMVRLSVGQSVKTEWEGSWWWTRVEAIDASLVKVVFHVNGRREAIYRGSTRLGPLYSEMQQQKKHAEVGGAKHIARRNHMVNRARGPYVEYTRNADLMGEDDPAAQAAQDANGQAMVKRAVARKSTTARKNDLQKSSRPDPNRVRWESKGTVRKLQVEVASGIAFVKHQCTTLCLDDPKFSYDDKKRISTGERLKDFNPLLVPLILGWARQITKHKNAGRRSVYYVSPCGRRLRSLEEVLRYLRVTHSTLEIDFFNFDWYVHVYNFYTPERSFYKIDDISYGKENVPVSCVNSLDNNYPEYVEYSTVRLPQEQVRIPTDEGFLTCCDCTDDCQDKARCSCWQLTIQSTAASDPDGRVNLNVGYDYRRLHEAVATGIYECNKFCKCKNTCLNRVAQHPLRAQLQVFKTERRGWGIRTLADIPKGGFVCIYVGNLYTNEEANKQGQDFGDEYFAELDLIEVVESRKDGYESDFEGDVEVLSDDADYKVNGSANNSSDDDDDDDDGDDYIEKSSAKAMSGGQLTLDGGSDRQTRQKNKAASNNGKHFDSLLADDSDDSAATKASSKPSDKPKYTSTRKFFHKDEDFYVMDAKSIGNIGRYLNHSCNPNCFVQNCFVDTHDLRFPWVAFFASGHISAGEELCWDYNYQVDQVQGKEIYCQCGADNCRGRLL